MAENDRGVSPEYVPAERPRVAAIVTEFRHRSHADVICTRMFDGYYPDGRLQEPRTQIVSMYTDQVPADDMSRGLAHRGHFTIYPTVADALTLGGDDLAVDAVLLIVEHGDYPLNERGQKMYPRYELFEQTVDVFRSSGRSVPVFNDKHLSYSWEKTQRMLSWARELRIPLMAGSSIPLTVRTSELEIPLGAQIRHAVQVYRGPHEGYGFHALEVMQSMVERRAGGETGIASVEMLEGEAVWRWRDGPGEWSQGLLEEALRGGSDVPYGALETGCDNPAAFVLTYRDGLEAAVYMLEGCARRPGFAAEVDGRIVATQFGQIPSRRDLAHFDGLAHCIEEFFVSGTALCPLERTVLTTGALAFLFESRVRHQEVETPLTIRYQAPEAAYFQRE